MCLTFTVLWLRYCVMKLDHVTKIISRNYMGGNIWFWYLLHTPSDYSDETTHPCNFDNQDTCIVIMSSVIKGLF